MATGDPKFIGIEPGVFYPQEGYGFTENELGGFDYGDIVYLIHPDTPRNTWPQLGAPHPDFPKMRVSGGVRDRKLESTLIELTVPYKGLIKGEKLHKLTPGCETAMFAFAALSSGNKIRLIAPVPMPTMQRDYVTFTQPDYEGCGASASGDYLLSPPSFSVSFVPDPDEPAALNYITGWVLASRTWEELGTSCWLVSERFTYYYSIAG